MSFAIFNEAFYLANNPDVQAAVKAGVFKSGLEHFQQYGIKEGRVSVSAFYDETYYLQNHPDVAAAVKNGAFGSGLQHYIEYGETEGRQANVLFDEGFYLRKNPDVAAAVKAGSFTSGLAHYLQFGQAEGRSGTNFNEFGYIGEFSFNKVNPDVEAAVKAGSFGSALEHYLKYGQFEDRSGIFTGTSGNDTVTGFGQIDLIYGVDRSPGPCVLGGTPTGGQCLDFYSLGVNEADVLIGGSGKDTFVLGRLQTENKIPPARSFYIGGGDADFATIENFELGKDTLVLGGSKDNYLFSKSDGDLNIFLSASGFGGNTNPLSSPDLVATVKGVTSVGQIENSLQFTGGFLSA